MPASRSITETHPALVEKLVQRAQGAAAAFGGVPRERFLRALERSVAKRFSSGRDAKQISSYLESLLVEDLALAVACSEGTPAAWEHFVAAYRPDLYAAARSISRGNEAAARELADSLYADLFGMRKNEAGERNSLFDYFHGRSKLSTWLRAVLAQRYVDTIRAASRMEPLDEPTGKEGLPRQIADSSAETPLDPKREEYLRLLQAALSASLATLAPRDRLRLASYYVQDMTLAQIGRITGEHEATVSRHLERTRRELRRQVDRALREEQKLSEAQIALCYEYAMEDWPFDLSRALSSATMEGK
jgi:RNA polymerase sigma-70 factor